MTHAKDSGGPPLHPIGATLVLALDWALFGTNALSLGLATPAVAGIGFTTGLVGVSLIQRGIADESWTKSLAKGFCAGIAVGIPTPIVGTAAGGLLLGWAGLSKASLARKLIEHKPKDDAPE